MTTIAYSHKHKQIAIDSRITTNGVIRCDSYDKIIRNDIGTWFFSGSCCDNLALSLMKHDDHCDVVPQCSALLISEGDVYLVLVNDVNYCEWFETTHDAAYGSGQDFAIAALDFGKTPKEAVEYAMTRDCNTGGSVQVVDV
jgi:hypothetical protein